MLALNADRMDGDEAVISWGGTPRQHGDLNEVGHGRAAARYSRSPSDGLARIIGTVRLLGATTPADGPVRRGEFPGQFQFDVVVQGNLLLNGTGQRMSRARVDRNWSGRRDGWDGEVDPPWRDTARENICPRPLSARDRTRRARPEEWLGAEWATIGARATPGSS